MRWPAEAIWEAVQGELPGFTVEILPEVDSTNSELMRRARAGTLAPTLLVAERQTAGRGRLGRQWHSAAADDAAAPSLTFSLGLPLAPPDWSGLSLAVGVAVAEALHPAIRLKWPNDLWLEGRKLGGILVETATAAGSDSRQAVIGIGLNVGPRPAEGLSTPPAWLQELEPGLDAPAVLGRVAAPLVRAVLAFQAGGFAPFQAPFQARDGLAGRQVTLSDGKAGEARGVDAGGALLVQGPGGLQAVTSSEVSVRPAA